MLIKVDEYFRLVFWLLLKTIATDESYMVSATVKSNDK